MSNKKKTLKQTIIEKLVNASPSTFVNELRDPAVLATLLNSDEELSDDEEEIAKNNRIYESTSYLINSKKYNYLNEETLHKDFQLTLDEKKTENPFHISICMFKINQSCKEPFLQFFVRLEEKNNENYMVFPSIELTNSDFEFDTSMEDNDTQSIFENYCFKQFKELTGVTYDVARKAYRGYVEEYDNTIYPIFDCTYIDLFLIHHSCGNDSDFVVFKQAVDENLIRFYGVSNCEDIGILTDLKTKHNIFANQIQARSPNGSIDRRMRFPPDFNFFDFVNKCNSIDIRIMLFASVSGIVNSINYEDMSLLERIPNLVRLTNPYYMHKFLFNQQIRVPDDFSTNPIIMIKHLLRFMKDINVSNHSISNSLIVSSSNLRSTTLLENMTHFEQISRGENLLSYSEFIEIEDFLESHQLALM
jgi:hypothetical protein